MRSQRVLAGHLGIALGLTNSLIRALADEKLIRTVTTSRRGARYVLTARGRAEYLHLSRAHLAAVVQTYTQAREGIRRRLSQLSAQWAVRRSGGGTSLRVVSFGSGDLAEIAFTCFDAADLELVGVVDDAPATVFRGLPIRPPTQLKGTSLDGEPFDVLLIASGEPTEHIEHCLKAIGFPRSRAVWL